MPKLERLQLNQTNRPLDTVLYWNKSGSILLNPPYQRGDVWGPIRRVNLMRSIIQSIPIPSIVINDRGKAEWDGDTRLAVIDGRQRMTTILMFLTDKFEIPGEWFGQEGNRTYSQLDIRDQRRIENLPIAFSEGAMKTLEDERTVFEMVNFGGVPQGESDMNPEE